MNQSTMLGCLLLVMLQGCVVRKGRVIYDSPTLQMVRLTRHTYIHHTYLQTDSWGKVSCNGLVYTHGGEAMIFDTPVDDSSAIELLYLVGQQLHARVKGIVVNHFHEDCLGGLQAFHDRGIPSYANSRTLKLAAADTANHPVVPMTGFEDTLTLWVGGKQVLNSYHGRAHTTDNIVSYIPDSRVLFGGCPLKALGAGKGYLGDADTTAWSQTIRNVKAAYPKARYIVPGHGASGGRQLLDYTINMFEYSEHK
jgi:metallo-beta-lactamase class B